MALSAFRSQPVCEIAMDIIAHLHLKFGNPQRRNIDRDDLPREQSLTNMGCVFRRSDIWSGRARVRQIRAYATDILYRSLPG